MNAVVAEANSTELNDQLERWIEQRTGNRIRCLRVGTYGRRVVVRGFAGSHYVRQLALAAIFEVLADRPPDEVELNIEVVSGRPPPRRVAGDEFIRSQPWMAAAMDAAGR